MRIAIIGAPGIENIKRMNLPTKDEILKEKGIDLTKLTVLCSYHPVTINSTDSEKRQIETICLALVQFPDIQFIFTYPGADTGFSEITVTLKKESTNNKNIFLYKDLGSKYYLGIMKYSLFVLGNSSSGIVEAPSFGIPSIDIGRRQEGRESSKSVIRCNCETNSIIRAIKKAKTEKFQSFCKTIRNPYDVYPDCNIGEKVLNVIKRLPSKNVLLNKKMDFEVKENEWNFLGR